MGARKRTTKDTRIGVYAAARYVGSDVEKELGVQIPFDVYCQDPLVAREDPKFGFEKEFYVRWEPGLTDGPTSARFAVVDFNGDTGHLVPKARWDPKHDCFKDTKGKKLDRANVKSTQFHQVNVWAILQRALSFFEEPPGLGRRIPFGFDGNRLIVVPHAGYGKNAFYDRQSKSLQFYYFDEGDRRVYTCLSTDIINHEFGHAVLDGIRPYLFESALVETGAFHESVGDLTAILILLRNNDFRRKLAEATAGRLSEGRHLARIAQEFGRAVSGNEYLRTAQNTMKMSDIRPHDGPHQMSEVLTGAMFDILLGLADHYVEERDATAKEAFAYAIRRMQCVAIQPLDLLPPVDVTFRDYAIAVLRADALANPMDPHRHRDRMLDAFVAREILSEEDRTTMSQPQHLYERLDLSVYHDIGSLSRSRAAAYSFLDDNREKLFIPSNQDVIVADLYDANKRTRAARRLPRQTILEYVWREDVVMEGARFGEYEGKRTSMLCGGTLVFDQNGSVLIWARKPGTQGGTSDAWTDEIERGKKRRDELLDSIARRTGAGHVGAAIGSSKGLLGSKVPPLTVRTDGNALHFLSSPHMSLAGEDQENYKGGRRWEPSS